MSSFSHAAQEKSEINQTESTQDNVKHQISDTLLKSKPIFELREKDIELKNGKIHSLFFTYNPVNHPSKLYKITIENYTVRHIEDQKQKSLGEDEYSYIKITDVNLPKNIVIQEYSSRKRSK